MENLTEKLIDPLKYYYEEVKGNFKKETTDFFDELVKKSNIDIEENIAVAKEYEKLLEEKEEISKKLQFNKTLGIVAIIVGIISIVVGIVIYFLNRYDLRIKNIVIIVISIGLGIGMLFWRFGSIKNKMEELSLSLAEFEEKCRKKLEECYESILPLNNLMDSKYTFQLINKNISFVEFDANFNMKRFEEMYCLYGMENNNNKNYSTLEAASGNILGNPFVLLKELIHTMKEHTYSGSLRISWKESYYDNTNKEWRTRNRSETLRATVTKPKPEYSQTVSLLFANNVAGNLKFHRYPAHIEKLSESEINKKIKKEEKKINKLEEKSLKKGENFVAMSNTEFEVLFNALNRNNETEFRLLFTPVAQRNIVKLLKNKMYGDNFYFEKSNKINKIIAEHTEKWDLDCSAYKFKSYSYEKCRNYFVEFNTEYFNNFFFSIAPLISIPLYQQYMATDYIYDKKFRSNYNLYTAETIANAMSKKNFVHQETKTQTILKASPMGSDGTTDLVKITAYSYKIVPRIDYVRMKGGDGNYHDVPVHWDEYINLLKESTIELKELGIDDTKFNQLSNSKESNKNIFSDKNSYVYKNKFFAKLTNKEFIELEESLNGIIS